MNHYQITSPHTKQKYIVEANSAEEAAQKIGCYIKQVSPIAIGQPKLTGIPISKAIEILDLNIKEVGPKMPPDVLDALNLGVQALNAILIWRKDRVYFPLQHLPAETEET